MQKNRSTRLAFTLYLTCALTLSACGDDSQSGPGGVPPGDAKALDEAAEMVEQGRPPLPVDEPAEVSTKDDNNESGGK